MSMKQGLWIAFGLAALAVAIGAAWIAALPLAPMPRTQPPIPREEVEATLKALKPPKRERPLIAILGINEGTETTDYLMPYGILKRADVAKVLALGTKPGAVSLYPALTAIPDATTAAFDARHPEGADYVIVPAMHRDDDPEALAWLKAQAAKGATVIGVCAGAMVVAQAGLLDGKRATTHWYFLDGLRKTHPTIRIVPDRRLVVDRGVATTTGISASMPMALTLIEAIAGRDRAEALARDLGLAQWDMRHDSAAYRFNRPFALTAMRNTLAVWSHETFGLALRPGIDEVSLALVADAWSRTSRSRVRTLAGSAEALTSRAGLRLLPDRLEHDWPAKPQLPPIGGLPPATALDGALEAIAARYGDETARFVATQLEYPGPAAP